MDITTLVRRVRVPHAAHTWRGVMLLLLLALVVVPAGPARAYGHYMDELSAEASKPVYTQKAEQEIKEKRKAGALPGNASLAKIDSITAFEVSFSKNFPSNYDLYIKLSTTDRVQIYQYFMKSRDLGLAAVKTVELFIKRRAH